MYVTDDQESDPQAARNLGHAALLSLFCYFIAEANGLSFDVRCVKLSRNEVVPLSVLHSCTFRATTFSPSVRLSPLVVASSVSPSRVRVYMHCILLRAGYVVILGPG